MVKRLRICLTLLDHMDILVRQWEKKWSSIVSDSDALRQKEHPGNKLWHNDDLVLLIKMHVLQLSLLHSSGLRCLEWLHDRLGTVFCIFCTCSLSTPCTRRHQSNDGITQSSFMQFTMSADSVLSVLPVSLALSLSLALSWQDDPTALAEIL